jgi:hypothetical protein
MALFGKKEEAKNFDHFKKVIEEIIREWELDPDALYNPEFKSWALKQGSADFWITLFSLDGTDFMEVAASVVKLPEDNLLPFYRRLLELNDYYIGVKLSAKDNQIWLLGQRECEGMDKGEAKRLIDNVRLIADDIDDKLMQEFSALK